MAEKSSLGTTDSIPSAPRASGPAGARVTLVGSSDSVSALSPSGRFFVFQYVNGVVTVYETNTRTTRATDVTEDGYTRPTLRAVRWSPDESAFAVVLNGGGVALVKEGSLEGPAPAVPSYLLPDRPQATDLRGTALSLDVPRKEALPFSAVAPPVLTLEQHASMTVDIAAAPEHALEVLARYRLTLDAKRAVDEYYRAMIWQRTQG